MESIYELRSLDAAGIFAVPYRAGRRRRAIRLPDGAIVEAPLPGRRGEVPTGLAEVFEVGAGGVPATIHHANLGLIVAHLSLTGVFHLSSGETGAVYGAEAVPLGLGLATSS